MKKIALILGSIILLIGAMGSYYKFCMDPARGAVKQLEESMALTDTLSKEEAKQDLQYIMNTLETFHPAWLDRDEALIERVESQYNKELESLKDEITMLELWQKASRIIHEMYDAHSRVSVQRLEGEESYIFDGEIMSINGQSIDSIYEQFLQLWPYELETYAKTRFEKYMIYKEYLELYGVDTSNGIDVTYQRENGEETVHLEAQVQEGVSKPYATYEIDQENSVGILSLTQCKASEAYLEALEAFFDEVGDKQVQDIVVDLRYNNGGWMPVVKDFLKYIDVDEYQYCNDFKVRYGSFWYREKEIIKNEKVENPFKGDIYILTGPKTFSAAMNFAMIIKDNGLGQLVGETCGNTPDSYTYNQKYQLPNSKLKLVVSCTKQSRIDESKIGELLVPDYEVNEKQALEKVYEIIG